MCGTRGADIVSSVADVLWISVVRGIRGVGGVCEICMCLDRGGVGREGVRGKRGGEWMRELGLGFSNPVGTGGMLDVGLSLGCDGVRGVNGERVWVGDLDQGLEGRCYVCVICESGLSV